MKIDIDLSGLLPHQRKLVKSQSRKTALICGRGAGKSYVCACLCLLYLIRGFCVLVGGQRYDTLHDTLFDEIKKLAFEWGLYDFIEWRERPMMLTLGDAHVWFGTYESVEACRGYSRVALMILDEMFLAPTNILSVWGPCQRNAGVQTRIVGATTPRGGSLWNVMFADPDCDWEIITASSFDNTHNTEDELKLILSEIHDQTMYDQEVLGKIVTGLGASAIIHLEDFPRLVGTTTDTRVIAGFDAGEGVERDASAFFKRQGNRVLESWKLNGINHEECVRRIRESNSRLKIDRLNMDAAFSDYEFGILQYEVECEQVRFARSPTEPNREKYANVRAEMFFNLAWTVKNGLYVGDMEPTLGACLKQELCAISWFKDKQGRLLITPKEDLRAALKRSTDIADAAALTCLDRWQADDPVIQTRDTSLADRQRLRRYSLMMG